MSKRRELTRHMASLADIGELLDAMKGLALVESRRVAAFIDAQRAVVGIIRTTLADFLQDQPGFQQTASTRGEILCMIGTQRGFCGDLNPRLVDAALERLAAGSDASPDIVLVGGQLTDAWPNDAPEPAAQIPGAGFADEVQAVLIDLIATLTPLLLRAGPEAAPAVSLLYIDESGPVHQPLLPAPLPALDAPPRSHPMELNLPPDQFHRALLDQFLEAMLNGVLYEALLYENQQRLDHMEQARDRIDERLEDLGRQANRARQEEITEEIEILLISSLAVDKI